MSTISKPPARTPYNVPAAAQSLWRWFWNWRYDQRCKAMRFYWNGARGTQCERFAGHKGSHRNTERW